MGILTVENTFEYFAAGSQASLAGLHHGHLPVSSQQTEQLVRVSAKSWSKQACTTPVQVAQKICGTRPKSCARERTNTWNANRHLPVSYYCRHRLSCSWFIRPTRRHASAIPHSKENWCVAGQRPDSTKLLSQLNFEYLTLPVNLVRVVHQNVTNVK